MFNYRPSHQDFLQTLPLIEVESWGTKQCAPILRLFFSFSLHILAKTSLENYLAVGVLDHKQVPLPQSKEFSLKWKVILRLMVFIL